MIVMAAIYTTQNSRHVPDALLLNSLSVWILLDSFYLIVWVFLDTIEIAQASHATSSFADVNFRISNAIQQTSNINNRRNTVRTLTF